MRDDPRDVPWSGVAVHGNTPFDTRLVTRVDAHTYLGGCVDGMRTPDDVEYVVSLYPWEHYLPGESFVESTAFGWLDAGLPELSQLRRAAALVSEYRRRGVTLVHCQAGLNRSGLVLAYALFCEGMSSRDAIELLRARRSPAVLCNPHFRTFLLALETPA